jgi:hypothetical protein
MSPFPDVLIFRDAGMRGGSRVFELMERYRYLPESGERVFVPAGFLTDGASIPRAFWSLFSPVGKCFGAAIIHDYLYSPGNTSRTRLEADRIFLQAMTDSGVGWMTRQTIYRAIRIGGRSAWKAARSNL